MFRLLHYAQSKKKACDGLSICKLEYLLQTTKKFFLIFG